MNKYYHNQFRQDLEHLNYTIHNVLGKEYKFFGNEKWQNYKADLQNISNENKPKFILSLFITISVDQAFYSFLTEEQYNRAESLLRYPKFGWCGMGPHNEPPKNIIIRPLEFGEVNGNNILHFKDDAMKLYIEEVKIFQQNYFRELNVRDFFLRLVNDRDIISYRESIVYEEIYRCLLTNVNRL